MTLGRAEDVEGLGGSLGSKLQFLYPSCWASTSHPWAKITKVRPILWWAVIVTKSRRTFCSPCSCKSSFILNWKKKFSIGNNEIIGVHYGGGPSASGMSPFAASCECWGREQSPRGQWGGKGPDENTSQDSISFLDCMESRGRTSLLEDIEIYTVCDFVQSHLTGRSTLQSCHHSVWNWSFSNCHNNWRKKYFETLLALSRELQDGNPRYQAANPSVLPLTFNEVKLLSHNVSLVYNAYIFKMQSKWSQVYGSTNFEVLQGWPPL